MTVPASSGLRVLIATDVYPPAIGGPSQQTRSLARSLTDRGAAVWVVTSSAGAEPGCEFDVKVYTRGSRQWTHARAMEEIEDFRPSVIHAQTLGGVGRGALLAARRAGVPSLLKFAGGLTHEVSRSRPWFRMRRTLSIVNERLALLLADRVWATTPTVGASLPVTPKKLWVHPNFIDIAPFVSARSASRSEGGDGSARLLVVARLKPLKGIHVAIEALSHLPDRFRLTIAGDGESGYKRELRGLAERLGLMDRVQFLGRIPPDQTADLYVNADLLVVPSLEEAFGIVIVEAAAAGLPAVASRVGGVPDVVVDGQTGRLVPPGDPASLAQAVKETIDAPGRRSTLAHRAYEWGQAYDIESGVDALTEVYRNLERR